MITSRQLSELRFAFFNMDIDLFRPADEIVSYSALRVMGCARRQERNHLSRAASGRKFVSPSEDFLLYHPRRFRSFPSVLAEILQEKNVWRQGFCTIGSLLFSTRLDGIGRN